LDFRIEPNQFTSIDKSVLSKKYYWSPFYSAWKESTLAFYFSIGWPQVLIMVLVLGPRKTFTQWQWNGIFLAGLRPGINTMAVLFQFCQPTAIMATQRYAQNRPILMTGDI
jgi:hypothetical protein